MTLSPEQQRTLIEIARGNRTEIDFDTRTLQTLDKERLIYQWVSGTVNVTDKGRALANELESHQQESLVEQLGDRPEWLFQPEVEYHTISNQVFAIEKLPYRNNAGVIYRLWEGSNGYPVTAIYYTKSLELDVIHNPTPRLPHITWELSLGKNGGVRGNATIWHDVERQQGLTLTFGFVWNRMGLHINLTSTLPAPDTIEDAASLHQIYMKAGELESPICYLLRRYPGE